MALHPALDVASADADFVLAIADEFSPSAAEPRAGAVRVFFARAADRDRAAAALRDACPAAAIASVDVDDEDWARRSQENLPPVTVGKITIVGARGLDPGAGDLVLIISPSMGFGTGHHASTRLCLAALQTLDLHGKRMLDVGTGSGILAIAAAALGAASAAGIDVDADAIASAHDNLALNPSVRGVSFALADLTSVSPAPADIVAANLTGVLLVRAASRLRASVAPGGTLIVSGLLADEEASVRSAFAGAQVVWRAAEDEWVGLAFNFDRPAGV